MEGERAKAWGLPGWAAMPFPPPRQGGSDPTPLDGRLKGQAPRFSRTCLCLSPVCPGIATALSPSGSAAGHLIVIQALPESPTIPSAHSCPIRLESQFPFLLVPLAGEPLRLSAGPCHSSAEERFSMESKLMGPHAPLASWASLQLSRWPRPDALDAHRCPQSLGCTASSLLPQAPAALVPRRRVPAGAVPEPHPCLPQHRRLPAPTRAHTGKQVLTQPWTTQVPPCSATAESPHIRVHAHSTWWLGWPFRPPCHHPGPRGSPSSPRTALLLTSPTPQPWSVAAPEGRSPARCTFLGL